jgi:hypothetical protein
MASLLLLVVSRHGLERQFCSRSVHDGLLGRGAWSHATGVLDIPALLESAEIHNIGTWIAIASRGLASAVFYLLTWEIRHEIMDPIPVFYWEGVGEAVHNIAITVASMLGLWYLALWCSMILFPLVLSLPVSFRQVGVIAYAVGYFGDALFERFG